MLCYLMHACYISFCTISIPQRNEGEKRGKKGQSFFLCFCFFSVEEEEQHYIPPPIALKLLSVRFFYSFIRACENEWMDEGADLAAV